MALLVVFLIIGRREWLQHQKNLKLIPLRIIVNGTRGKSSVTRLVGAGLKAGNHKVMSKTTGTKPRMILNNLNEIPIVRLGKANIKEQIAMVGKAVSNGLNAIVFENMSLRPDLQWTEETKLVQPKIVAITNVRADHLDVMGPTLADIARHFINAVPRGSTVITAEQDYYHLMKDLCSKRGITIIQSQPNDISAGEMARFPYYEHQENVALALAVCSSLGLKRDQVLQELYRCRPDPGVLQKYDLDLGGKRATLINALAANDPDSTYRIFEQLSEPGVHTYILVNCRSDRIDRSLQMADLVSQKMPAEMYFATGANTMPFVKKVLASGIGREKILNLGGKKVEDVVNAVGDRIRDRSQIFAIGNIVGYGESLIACFGQKASK
ncbi:MAG TPA: poly-gamma-glutamate synthase PgsB [bacterium]